MGTYTPKIKRYNGVSWDEIKFTKSQITDFPTSMPASDVYSWAKASSKPSYSFYEIGSRGDEYIEWGGPSQVGAVSPIGLAISNEHNANRMAFINGEALLFEYSTDNGSTWTNYSYNSNEKSELFTKSRSIHIGHESSSVACTTSSKTRITLSAQNGEEDYVYCDPKKLLINVSSAHSMTVLIETRTGTNYQYDGAWSTYGTYNVSGWSGWNDIPLILGTLGGAASQLGNNWQLRLTFSVTSVNPSYATNCYVMGIRIYAPNNWTKASIQNSKGNMSDTGHLYDFDMNANATFPNAVTATCFSVWGGSSGEFLKADGSKSSAIRYLNVHNDSTYSNADTAWSDVAAQFGGGAGFGVNKTNEAGSPYNNDGVLINAIWSSAYGFQIWGDDGGGNGGLAVRNRNGSGFNAWMNIVRSGWGSNRSCGSASTPIYIDDNGIAQPCTSTPGSSHLYKHKFYIGGVGDPECYLDIYDSTSGNLTWAQFVTALGSGMSTGADLDGEALTPIVFSPSGNNVYARYYGLNGSYYSSTFSSFSSMWRTTQVTTQIF